MEWRAVVRERSGAVRSCFFVFGKSLIFVREFGTLELATETRRRFKYTIAVFRVIYVRIRERFLFFLNIPM